MTSSTTLNLVLEAMQRLETSNEDLKKAFDTLRESLPVAYIPRSENERVITALQAGMDKIDVRLREVENARYNEIERRYEGQSKLSRDISNVHYNDTQQINFVERHFTGILLSACFSVLTIVCGFVIANLVH